MMTKRHIFSLAIIYFAALFAGSAFGAETMKPGDWISVATAVKSNGVKAYDGGKVLGNCDDGDWVEFGPLDLSDGLVDRVEIRLAAPNATGKISFRLDKPSGTKIAEISIGKTGGYNAFSVQDGDCEQLAGTHTVYLVFEGGNNLCNVKEFRFLKPGQKGEATSSGGTASTPANTGSIIEPILKANREAIEKNRTTMVTIKAKPGATVTVKQVKHHFEFGTAINRSAFMPNSKMSETDQKKYKEVLLENFNSVVHENAMKWYSNEREKDKQTFEAADTMLKWCEENGLYTRGHCIYWGRDAYVQKWIKELDDDALRAKLQERAKIYMTRYKGRVLEHDVNNEMVHCTYFKKRLSGEIWKQMFAWCAEYDPKATLYVNDYSILSGRSAGKYVKQIEGFIKSGMKVGGIGVQGHFGGKINGAAVKKTLDQLAQFKLPIKVTEFDVNTKDEQAKSIGLANLYVTAFAHPAVEGIYMWGFWKKCHWRPNAGLWNADWSETPAAKVYRDLVFNKWWTDATAEADDKGTCKVRVFYGDHAVTVNGKTKRFSIIPSTKTITIDCSKDDSSKWVMAK